MAARHYVPARHVMRWRRRVPRGLKTPAQRVQSLMSSEYSNLIVLSPFPLRRQLANVLQLQVHIAAETCVASLMAPHSTMRSRVPTV